MSVNIYISMHVTTPNTLTSKHLMFGGISLTFSETVKGENFPPEATAAF